MGFFPTQYNYNWHEGSYNLALNVLKAIAWIFQGENDWIGISILS